MVAFYRVYVLQNAKGRFYIGISDDISRRTEQHNSGKSRWTKGQGPWVLVWPSEELSLSTARKRENLLKRQKGGSGFYRLTRLPRREAHNPAAAGPRVQIPPPQPIFLDRELCRKAALREAGPCASFAPFFSQHSSVAQW